MKPLIVINFKTYQKASSSCGLKLASEIRKVNRSKYDIIIVPTILTIREIAKRNKLKVFAQHVSPYTYGSHTGCIILDELKSSGVSGCLLNHSEKKIPYDQLVKTIELCKSKRMKTIVCASTLRGVKKIAELEPDFIAYEPQELIGGDISVTESNPDLIVKVVEAVKEVTKKTKMLCGAGIHSKEDVGQALLLGAKGVLLAHAVVGAKNPKKILEEMLI
jgi:triosephosphate isomerase (TIM)